MRRLRSFFALPRRERRTLLAALAAVAWTRVLLWILPYAAARSVLDAGAPRHSGSGASLEAIARDVTRAARVVPRATCLVQALAAERLLRRAGASATVRFGVARGEAGFEAHAWLESGGRVVLGGDGLGRFVPLERS